MPSASPQAEPVDDFINRVDATFDVWAGAVTRLAGRHVPRAQLFNLYDCGWRASPAAEHLRSAS